ncbi:MAG TPA: hypothetical protein VFE05_14820 [Longimicrobiaceae bacterium]|nr:hypothetical protein [Longimicrobiaceae bacterium]
MSSYHSRQLGFFMARLTGFVAYPSKPLEIGRTILSALREISQDKTAPALVQWEENDIAGRFLNTPILANIDERDILVADITSLNFNVVFEIGYAIGRRKRTFLIQNNSIVGSSELIRQIGIFDTLGYKEYGTSAELAAIFRGIVADEGLPIPDTIATGSPVYLVMPRKKSDVEVRIASRLKKARVSFRTFDPDELGRLPAGEAIDGVARSHGVVVPLLARHRTDSEIHNFRAAFVSGLAIAMEKELVLLQDGQDPVPLDYRDLVKSYRSLEQIDDYIAEFAIEIGARFQRTTDPIVAEPKTFLERLNLGASAAENELQELGNYYLQTAEYQRAVRGEVRVVTGRKGAGKTALFSQLRDRLRKERSLIVLDLRPEGFQLLKLKERVLDFLEEGTKEHTITAFWEYLLFLEIAHRLLEKDRQVHMRNADLFEPYQRLRAAHLSDAYLAEGDFSERLITLTERIADDFSGTILRGEEPKRLSRGEITELLYRHDIAALRDAVVSYLEHKDGVWILFDNLDKGWPAHGISPADVLTLRSLVDAMAKIERDLSRRKIVCHGVVFIRNDVFELLVSGSADRGKLASINLDWTDPDLLREILRKRFIYSEGVTGDPVFEEIWREISVTHVNGEESSQYLIDRSLLRPRALIELVQFCRSHAVNLGHGKIEVGDIHQGEHHYSNQMLSNIGYELADVAPTATDILWEFFGGAEQMSGEQVQRIIADRVGENDWESVFQMLLWYGFLGVVRDNSEPAYIYSVEYETKRLNAIIRQNGMSLTLFRINPAFWRALEIVER